MGHIDTERGITLVDVVVGVAVMVLVFTALIASFQAAAEFGTRNQLRAAALLVANEELETIRALPYDDIGTVSGLPPGAIPQLEDVVEDGHTYTRRTFIQYVDDPADGSDAADPLTADYKRIRVEISYTYHDATQSVSLVTSIAPKSQESLVGAGVLRIKVADADNQPVSGATVHIFNTTVATSVDVTTLTNASGTVSFPGAWAGTGYNVTVTKSGYSTAQTYPFSPGNPSPSPSPATVDENGTTEIIFKIDRLSTLELRTIAWPGYDRLYDSFADTSQLATPLDGTQIQGGALILSGAPGSYVAAGTATSVPLTPGAIDSWLLVQFDQSLPQNTALTCQIVYDAGGGTFAPVPDAVLPGNAAGFSTGPIDLGALDPVVYTSLALVARLTSADPNVSPHLLSWSLSYLEPAIPIGNVSFTLHGDKTIGTNGGADIYKYDVSDHTAADGLWQSGQIEWDGYVLDVPAMTVGDACPTLPISLAPDTNLVDTLAVETPTTNTLRVQVLDLHGAPIPRAEVHVTGGATDTIRSTSACGNVFFPALSTATYSVDIAAGGYGTTTRSVAVAGATAEVVTLTTP